MSEQLHNDIKNEFCPAIKPGKKSATIFGCIKLAGHKGGHINGRWEIWRDSAATAQADAEREPS